MLMSAAAQALVMKQISAVPVMPMLIGSERSEADGGIHCIALKISAKGHIKVLTRSVVAITFPVDVGF